MLTRLLQRRPGNTECTQRRDGPRFLKIIGFACFSYWLNGFLFVFLVFHFFFHEVLYIGLEVNSIINPLILGQFSTLVGAVRRERRFFLLCSIRIFFKICSFSPFIRPLFPLLVSWLPLLFKVSSSVLPLRTGTYPPMGGLAI